MKKDLQIQIVNQVYGWLIVISIMGIIGKNMIIKIKKYNINFIKNKNILKINNLNFFSILKKKSKKNPKKNKERLLLFMNF